MKIRPAEAELFHVNSSPYSRTKRHDEYNSTFFFFCNFVNALKNGDRVAHMEQLRSCKGHVICETQKKIMGVLQEMLCVRYLCHVCVSKQDCYCICLSSQ